MTSRAGRTCFSLVLALLVAADFGCSAPRGSSCDAGMSVPCACANGAAGVRACVVGEDGAGTCVCSDASSPVDAADASALDAPDAPADAAGDSGPSTDVIETCVPACAGRQCGDDGCGHPCGMCVHGFICRGAGTCDLDPAVDWRLEVVDGTVIEHDASGNTWDSFGGLPDPLVCVTIGTDRQCSVDRADTLAPVWNFLYPTAVSVSALSAPMRIEVQDYDPTSANDVIGDVMTMATRADFDAPVWTVTVGRASIRMRLTVAP